MKRLVSFVIILLVCLLWNVTCFADKSFTFTVSDTDAARIKTALDNRCKCEVTETDRECIERLIWEQFIKKWVRHYEREVNEGNFNATFELNKLP